MRPSERVVELLGEGAPELTPFEWAVLRYLDEQFFADRGGGSGLFGGGNAFEPMVVDDRARRVAFLARQIADAGEKISSEKTEEHMRVFYATRKASDEAALAFWKELG